MRLIRPWIHIVALIWLFMVAGCASTPRPLPRCMGPTSAINPPLVKESLTHAP